MNVSQLRAALAEFPDYYEVVTEDVDEEWEPIIEVVMEGAHLQVVVVR